MNKVVQENSYKFYKKKVVEENSYKFYTSFYLNTQ